MPTQDRTRARRESMGALLETVEQALTLAFHILDRLPQPAERLGQLKGNRAAWPAVLRTRASDWIDADERLQEYERRQRPPTAQEVSFADHWLIRWLELEDGLQRTIIAFRIKRRPWSEIRTYDPRRRSRKVLYDLYVDGVYKILLAELGLDPADLPRLEKIFFVGGESSGGTAVAATSIKTARERLHGASST